LFIILVILKYFLSIFPSPHLDNRMVSWVFFNIILIHLKFGWDWVTEKKSHPLIFPLFFMLWCIEVFFFFFFLYFILINLFHRCSLLLCSSSSQRY
jgi:hypothetical protein